MKLKLKIGSKVVFHGVEYVVTDIDFIEGKRYPDENGIWYYLESNYCNRWENQNTIFCYI